MILRAARTGDLPTIMELERAGFAPSEQWSESSWRAELDGADRVVLVATEPAAGDGEGLLGVVTYQAGPDTADLMRIVVAPSARRRRVGRALVQAGMMQLNGRVEQVLLEVRHDNAPAIALYTGCGFTTVATRHDYYGTGAHALVMRAPVETDLPRFIRPQSKGTRDD